MTGVQTCALPISEGHGMRDAATTMLSFLNEAFPDCTSELAKLGLLKDPTKFINAEYVSGGKTNVMQYENNFLAFHGINELCEWLYRRETAKDNQQFFNELMEKYGNTKGTC